MEPMAADDPVLITCSISGAVASRAQCPAIPYTPAEYAAEARRAVDAGASMIHVHARRPDGTPSYAVEDFRANLTFLSDRAVAGLGPEEVTALPREGYHGFVFLADRVTVTDPDMPLVAVDLRREPGRWFRVVPTAMSSVENNLSLANMDFDEFADSVDTDGVFRGFSAG